MSHLSQFDQPEGMSNNLKHMCAGWGFEFLDHDAQP